MLIFEIIFNKNSSIEILNLEGQIMRIYNSVESSTTIDISSFAKGIYFVKVKTKKDAGVKMFVKE